MDGVYGYLCAFAQWWKQIPQTDNCTRLTEVILYIQDREKCSAGGQKSGVKVYSGMWGQIAVSSTAASILK